MKLPIGYDNFRKVVENQLDFVDKSLFIKEIIDNRHVEVAVITRPRRFGKTFNLSMLHHYFAKEVNGESTDGLFDRLKIMDTGEEYLQHQGKYPVIFITFKEVKGMDFKQAHAQLASLMSDIYSEHKILLSSPKLDDLDKKNFNLILERQGSEQELTAALKNLTRYLAHHYGVKPWLLIDEYDTPIQASYVYGYYEPMINLMRNLFGSVLKTNSYLHRAVITGILRIAKESLFSGLNNVMVYSMLRSEYGQHFGFTEDEVDGLLKKYGLEKNSAEFKTWYNGYQAGDAIVYNPWSVTNCIGNQGKLMPYWVNTSDNLLIRNLLTGSNTSFKEQFELLLQNQTVEYLIDENTVFGDLKINTSAAWSLLLMAGYLKVVSQRLTAQGLWCTLKIPNQEVKDLYRQIIEQWLAGDRDILWYNQFLEHLLSGNLELFERGMRQILERTVSVHDTAHDPEAFYHGLMIGLTASLYQSDNYEIQSNRESGYGRYDYMIFSRDQNKLTLILEFKKVDNVRGIKKLEGNLIAAAKHALQQIDEKKYLTDALQRDRKNILKIGFAFCGKHFKFVHEYLHI
jgi:hypothetical protein